MPSFEQSSVEASFNRFQTVSLDDVVAAVRALPDKSCTLDPLPTKLLKAAVDVILPFLTELFNRSPSFGHVPDVFKIAHISPLLKKADRGSSNVRPDMQSYRPISNLSVLSKLLERLVALQLKAHLDSCILFRRLQSFIELITLLRLRSELSCSLLMMVICLPSYISLRVDCQHTLQ
jgi:hypothetical protein